MFAGESAPYAKDANGKTLIEKRQCNLLAFEKQSFTLLMGRPRTSPLVRVELLQAEYCPFSVCAH